MKYGDAHDLSQKEQSKHNTWLDKSHVELTVTTEMAINASFLLHHVDKSKSPHNFIHINFLNNCYQFPHHFFSIKVITTFPSVSLVINCRPINYFIYSNILLYTFYISFLLFFLIIHNERKCKSNLNFKVRWIYIYIYLWIS